jgi:hypothetical protein
MQFNKFWFQEEKNKVHENLTATMQELLIRQAYRTRENLRHYMLYSNGCYTDSENQDYVYTTLKSKLYINLVQIIISTLLSKISRNKPKPTFLTEDGDYDQQQKAKKLDKFMYGQFYKSKVYDKTSKIFLNSGIFGTGFLHIYRNEKELMTEIVPADELVTDDRESLNDDPQNLYRYKTTSKINLISRFPKFEKEIKESCKLGLQGRYLGDAVLDDAITIIEAWHLPEYDGENGRHVICVDKATLLDEPWKSKYFPFPKFKFQERGTGFYGRGVSELISGIQMEANKIFERIQRNIHLTTVPRVLYNYASKIVKSHFNNEIGGMIGYAGEAPQFITPSGVAPELFEWLKAQIDFAFREIGTSELSATSQKPAGLNSGAAIREFSDIESDRFANLQQRWEQYHMDICDQMIDRMEEIYEEYGDFDVMAPDREGAYRLKWSEVRMSRNDYVMQVYPTSLLPSHPAGRLATVNEMIGGGLIDRVDALDLLDYPDVKKYISFETAPKQDILATISSLLKGEYVTPEPEQDLRLGVKMMQFGYLHYKHKGVKEDRLQLFKTWISDAQELIGQAIAEMQAQAPQLQGPQMQEQQMQGLAPQMETQGTTLEGQELAPQIGV